MTYKRYNEQLESFKILVKAMNFLVFQVSPSSRVDWTGKLSTDI